MIPKTACLFFLAAASLADVRKKALPLAGILMAGAAGLAYALTLRGDPFLRILLSLLPGMLLLALSRAARGAVGAGDGLAVLILGFFFPVLPVTLILISSLFTVFLVTVPLLLIRKLRYADHLPFLPFLLAGFVLFLTYTA